jgi:hypothetical protein
MLERVVRAVVAATVAGLVLIAPAGVAGAASAGPTDAVATAVVTASLGNRRAVAWIESGTTLYFQWQNADGTRHGGPLEITSARTYPNGDFAAIGSHLALAIDPGGALLGFPYTRSYGGLTYNLPGWVYITNDWKTSTPATTCDRRATRAPAFPAFTPAVAWNGSRYLAMSQCGAPLAGHPGTPAGIGAFRFEPAVRTSRRLGNVVTGGTTSEPAVGARGSAFVAAWQVVGPTGDLDVAGRRLDQLGVPAGPVLVLASGPGDQAQPAVGSGGGKVLVAWIEDTNVSGRFVNAASLSRSTILVAREGAQNHPWASPSGNGGWHLTWSDLRSGNNDVYVANVDKDLLPSPYGGQLLAGGAGRQAMPSVSTLAGGRAQVAYIDGTHAKVRELTARSAPTGTAHVISLLPG